MERPKSGIIRAVIGGVLMFGSTMPAFAEGSTKGDPTPVQTSHVFSKLVITEGNSVWSMASQRVKNVQTRLGCRLSNWEELEAVNAIKNLTVFQNGRDLNKLRPRTFIEFPVQRAIDLVVRNLRTDSLLHQGIDVIANPSENLGKGSSYQQKLGEVSRLLQDMLAPSIEISEGFQCFVLDDGFFFQKAGHYSACTLSAATPLCPSVSDNRFESCWSRVDIERGVPPKSALRKDYDSRLDKRPR